MHRPSHLGNEGGPFAAQDRITARLSRRFSGIEGSDEDPCSEPEEFIEPDDEHVIGHGYCARRTRAFQQNGTTSRHSKGIQVSIWSESQDFAIGAQIETETKQCPRDDRHTFVLQLDDLEARLQRANEQLSRTYHADDRILATPERFLAPRYRFSNEAQLLTHDAGRRQCQNRLNSRSKGFRKIDADATRVENRNYPVTWSRRMGLEPITKSRRRATRRDFCNFAPKVRQEGIRAAAVTSERRQGRGANGRHRERQGWRLSSRRHLLQPAHALCVERTPTR